MNEIEANRTAVTRATGNSYEKLLNKLKIDLKELEPSLSPECCIYSVPSNLRRVNEAAYTPHFVSIGPLHYCDKNLKKMEKHKLKCLERFLKRAEGRADLEDFVGYVKTNEERVRGCYAETFDLHSDEFARMILVDASFIIEHFLKWWFEVTGSMDEIGKGHQLIFDIPSLYAALFYKDLVLLENQLPFFVLEDLCGMVFRDRPFSLISHRFFAPFNDQRKRKPEDFKHFTDLVRYYQLRGEKKEEKEQSSWFSDCSSKLSKVLQQPLEAPLRVGFRVLSLLLCQKAREAKQRDDNGNVDCLPNETRLTEASVSIQKPRESKPIDDEGNGRCLYSATELHEAGVKFKVSSSKCLFDVKFTKRTGVFEMPRFTVHEHVEVMVRKLMALEQCHYPRESQVCDHFLMMDYLINTEKDVELLVQNKILVNQLGSNQAVASLMNKLGLEIFYYEAESSHSDTIKKLNEYYEAPHHKWIAALRHNYFKTPWRGASTFAAITLLLLTLAQTICSFLSL